MSELNGGDTTIPRDSKDDVPSARTTVPLGPASEGMSKAGISAMQGIDLLEPIKPEEWNTRPEPAPEQIELEKITQTELDAPIKESPVYTDPTTINPDANPDPSALPSEGESAIESPVSHWG